MTFGEMYAECAKRLQGRTWNLSVDAGSYNGVTWKVYVAEVSPRFASGATAERALVGLDAMLAAKDLPVTQTVADVGAISVEGP